MIQSGPDPANTPPGKGCLSIPVRFLDSVNLWSRNTPIPVLMQEGSVSANDTPVASAEGATGLSEEGESSLESPLELLQAMSK